MYSIGRNDRSVTFVESAKNSIDVIDTFWQAMKRE